MTIAQKFVLARHFEGLPKKEDFRLVKEVLPPLQQNGKSHLCFQHLFTVEQYSNLFVQFQTIEVLIEAMYFSISAGSRPFAAMMMKIGDIMMGYQVARF